MKQTLVACFSAIITVFIVACGATNPPTISEGHIKSDSGKNASNKADIPLPVTQVPALPRPGKREKLETYTVVVNQVPIRELLFSMARDADLNLDIDNDITGKITMNAIDQTLPKILERIESQANITYIVEGDTIKVKADKPYLYTYNIDYLNIARSSEGEVSVSTEIGATSTGIQTRGGGGGGGGARAGSGGENNANSKIKNKSTNEFWKTITKNISAILNEEITTGSQNKTSNNVIVTVKLALWPS